MSFSVSEDLCEAYRLGCQREISAKMSALNDRMIQLGNQMEKYAQQTDANQIALKVVQSNEIQHLKDEIQDAKTTAEKAARTRREPLSARDWAKIITTIILAGFGFLGAVLAFLK